MNYYAQCRILNRKAVYFILLISKKLGSRGGFNDLGFECFSRVMVVPLRSFYNLTVEIFITKFVNQGFGA